MSATDYQSGCEALGARLRELRAQAGLQGKELADRLGWQRSKISRLENGKQTATATDLQAWAQALGAPAEAADLLSWLRGLLTFWPGYRRWTAVGGGRAPPGSVRTGGPAPFLTLPDRRRGGLECRTEGRWAGVLMDIPLLRPGGARQS